MVVKTPGMVSGQAMPADCWHQVSVRSVKHWPARARRVNSVLAISVPGSGAARAWLLCGHNSWPEILSNCILILWSQISSCFRVAHDRSWKVEFCSHNNAMWGGWEYPGCLTFATPLNKPLTSPGSWATENTNKDRGGEEEGDKEPSDWLLSSSARDCVRSWAHLMELFPDIPDPSPDLRPNGARAAEATPCRQLALSKLLIVFLCFMRILFVWTNIYAFSQAWLIPSHTATPTQWALDTIHDDFECV